MLDYIWLLTYTSLASQLKYSLAGYASQQHTTEPLTMV
jgi:hypothetical protein